MGCCLAREQSTEAVGFYFDLPSSHEPVHTDSPGSKDADPADPSRDVDRSVEADEISDLAAGSSQVEEGLTVTVLALSGASKRFEGISPDTCIAQLTDTVLREFCHGTVLELQGVGKLCHDTGELSAPASTMRELGFGAGEVTLNFVQTQALLTLADKDGKIVKVPKEIACMATKIQEAVEEHGPEQVISLKEVSESCLKQVMQYCAYHLHRPVEEIAKPLPSANLIECGVCEWDCAFMNDLEQEELFSIIVAANELGLLSLLDLACAKVASMIKGKNTEEIRKQFNIVNDFTPEEEAQIREENRWCEDA